MAINEKVLDKSFKVVITKGVPNEPNAINTYEFNCGNYHKSATDKVYNGALRIAEACGVSRDNCDISIYGLSLDLLEELSFLVWRPIQQVDLRNTISIYVDDVLIYAGDIYKTIADFTNAPDICLRIIGVVGTYIGVLPANDYPVEGLSLKTVFTELGNKAGFKTVVHPSVADKKFSKLTLYGSVRDQIVQAAKAVDLNFSIASNYIRVAPFGEVLGFSETDMQGDMTKSDSTIINYTNGLVGYPSFNNIGANFRTILIPTLKTGHLVDLYSIVPKVTGRHLITSKTMNLSTLPNGPWHADYSTTFIKSLDY